MHQYPDNLNVPFPYSRLKIVIATTINSFHFFISKQLSEELWSRVMAHWTEEQAVEIVYTITVYIMISKFGDVLHIQLEPVFQGLETQLI